MCGMDGEAASPRQRALQRHLQDGPQDPWRSGLADVDTWPTAYPSAWLRLLFGWPRHPSAFSRMERRADSLPAASHHAADAGRADWYRRHHAGQCCRATTGAYRLAGIPAGIDGPCVHAACRARRHAARSRAGAIARGLEGAELPAQLLARAVRDVTAANIAAMRGWSGSHFRP